MKLLSFSILILSVGTLLAACGQEQPSQTSVGLPVSLPNDHSLEVHDFGALPDPLANLPTVKSLMREAINPAARSLWTAVSYVVTSEGATETMPTTDADWQHLHEQADLLVKSGLRLMLPTIKVDIAGREGAKLESTKSASTSIANNGELVPADYKYRAAEIDEMIAQSPAHWRDYVERMQSTTLQLVGIIERRDLDAYADFGVKLNQACESCHAQYWYRPQSMPGDPVSP